MKAYRLIYSRASLSDLRELRSYLTHRFSSSSARGYIERLKEFCAELSISPHRGEGRQELRPRLRSIGFERRISVVFAISDDEEVVRILNFYYGGRRLSGAKEDNG